MAMRIAGEIGAKTTSRTIQRRQCRGECQTLRTAKGIAGNARETRAGKGRHGRLCRKFLAAHLQPWKNADQWGLVEEAQRELAQALSANEKLLAEIDFANSWIDQVDRKQQLLLQAGFSIPRELDPLHRKALLRLYELQAGLADDSSSPVNIRQISRMS